MSKKVIKSSNKNEKYNLKSVLDTDNIMSGVSLKAVTTIGCASVIASCNKDPEESKNGGDEDNLKWENFKAYQSKFGNSKENFEKFVSACKKQGISKDKIKEMIEQLKEQDVQKVLYGKEIKEENGKIKIDGKEIDLTETKSETNNTFSNFNNLSKEQKQTLEAYGITNQKTLDEFFKFQGNEEFKSKRISELFDEKGINDDNLKTKLEAYKNSKQQPTPQVSEEKVKKLKEFMQHNDDDYTIYNFYDNNIQTEEINKIYEKIKEGKLTPEDKDVNKKNLKDIIENKNNIKNVQLVIFKKIVDKLSKDKEYFEFSLDKNKQFQINIKFTLKNEKGENKPETESKTYKTEDINIQNKIDIETHQIYTELSPLKEITKSSIDEAFNLENAKKDGKDIADGAGETKDLNAYLAVLKNNFVKLNDLNISNDAIKTKIHGQLLKNIQAKLTDFVDKKLSTQAKGKPIDTNDIVAAMKNTGICKDDNAVKDADSMKKNPIDGKFFLSAIIGSGGFKNSEYTAMIDAMFTYFNDKYKADNVSKFKQNITVLKADDFTANDADTKLKINNNTCTYFAEDSAPDLTGYAKFKNVINKINAIGSVQIGNNGGDTFANGKTLADAADIDKVNKAFEAIHNVRKALDDVIANDTNNLIKESQLYKFLENIVGTEANQVEYPKYSIYNGTVGSPMPETGLTTTLKNVTGGLLPLAIMTTSTNFKALDPTAMGNILKANCTGEFQASILKYVDLCLPNNIQMTITKAGDAATNDYKIATVNAKNYNDTPTAQNWGCTSLGKINAEATSFVGQLLQVQSTIGTDQNKFLDYIRAMKVVEKIEYTAIDFTNHKAIYVGNTDNAKKALPGGTANRLNQHTALLTDESDFKQILPFLGKIELVIDILVANNVANQTNDAAGTANKFCSTGGVQVVDYTTTPIVPYNINRNRVYKDKDTALKDIKGTNIAKTDYSYGILVDV